VKPVPFTPGKHGCIAFTGGFRATETAAKIGQNEKTLLSRMTQFRFGLSFMR
jgi:hypothetical protein